MTVSMIWAQDRNGVLGTGRAMAWHVPADFRFFKTSTMGNPVIMGRASWEALGAKPLPGRRNFVLSSRGDFRAPGAIVCASLEEALEQARWASDQVWIAGGAMVYRQALPIADELVVTSLELELPPDGPWVYAPRIDLADWVVDEARSDTQWRPRSGDARWKVMVYRRRAAA